MTARLRPATCSVRWASRGWSKASNYSRPEGGRGWGRGLDRRKWWKRKLTLDTLPWQEFPILNSYVHCTKFSLKWLTLWALRYLKGRAKKRHNSIVQREMKLVRSLKQIFCKCQKTRIIQNSFFSLWFKIVCGLYKSWNKSHFKTIGSTKSRDLVRFLWNQSGKSSNWVWI